MKKFIKYGSIVVISLVILISCNVNSYDCDVFAEEKNEEQNTETDIICNWPEDIIDPGPALPQYLSAPKIMNILNTNKGIKVQWKKVNNAHGYRIQRKLGNSKWKDLKILKENQYTDKTVENGKKYQYKIYAYEVHPIASPEPHEKARHYLWRFWTRLPKTGHIAIFDRSWYGRVMVERLEGFCTENDWMRAYNEINEFEKELHDWGAVIIKFWVQIDKDTQLERFNERQNTPEKQWKITEEDWRNREKWDQYETAVNEMITKTSTTYAPWHILESVDKKYARIKALRIVIEELEKALD